MSPALSTAITALFLLAGVAAVWSMTVVLGGREPSARVPYRTIHRQSGWVFLLLFLVMFITMFGRLEDFWEESPPRVAIHFALAIACLFLVIVKIGVARYYKGLGKNLFALGVGTYLLAFPMAVLTGSYYLLRVLEGSPYISHAAVPGLLNEELGRTLLINKCSNCHLMVDILHRRTVKQWEEVMTRMVALARPRIRPAEARQVLNYLVSNYRRGDATPGGATPFDRHCSPCHERKELEAQRFDQKGWGEVVRRMNKHDPQLVPLSRVDEIVNYFVGFQRRAEAGER